MAKKKTTTKKAKTTKKKVMETKKTYNSAAKAEFRRSDKWRKFRESLMKRDKKDYITNSRLNPRANCHHLDMSSEHYEDLSNPDHFIMLNKRTHTMIHMLFSYYRKDPTILDRIKKILDEMVELNK